MSGQAQPNDVNQDQWEAILHSASRLIIVAGPGTGKTHTLIYRIVEKLKTFTPGQKALAITFTNKAAQEMKKRLEAKIPLYWKQVQVGTFHCFALSLLREFAEHTPLPKDFQIALPDEILSLSEEIFPGQTPAQRKQILEDISLMNSTQLAIHPTDHYQRYHRFLRFKGLIDFDDILRETLNLLENEDILLKVRQKFRHVFVDEYQDINLIQNVLLKILVGDTLDLTVIGDPNQSIYGFRGSEVKFFTRFSEDFPSASKVYLKENFRSTINLISASSQVIAKSSAQEVPETVAKIYEEGRLVIHEAATDRAEAEYVAHQIEQLVGGVSMFSQDSHRVETYRKAQRSFGDVAILYRLNAQKNVLIGALEHLGIPYSVSAKPKLKKEELQDLGQDKKDEILLQQFEESVDYNVEKVSLLTLHAAKGLEFPVVFIVGCEAKLLPLDLGEMKGAPEEERRLFYVGMTRAKEHLYLTRSGRRQIYGQTFFNPPSLFLADIEEDLKAYENSKLKRRLSKSKEAEKQQLKLF